MARKVVRMSINRDPRLQVILGPEYRPLGCLAGCYAPVEGESNLFVWLKGDPKHVWAAECYWLDENGDMRILSEWVKDGFPDIPSLHIRFVYDENNQPRGQRWASAKSLRGEPDEFWQRSYWVPTPGHFESRTVAEPIAPVLPGARKAVIRREYMGLEGGHEDYINEYLSLGGQVENGWRAVDPGEIVRRNERSTVLTPPFPPVLVEIMDTNGMHRVVATGPGLPGARVIGPAERPKPPKEKPSWVERMGL